MVTTRTVMSPTALIIQQHRTKTEHKPSQVNHQRWAPLMANNSTQGASNSRSTHRNNRVWPWRRMLSKMIRVQPCGESSFRASQKSSRIMGSQIHRQFGQGKFCLRRRHYVYLDLFSVTIRTRSSRRSKISNHSQVSSIAPMDSQTHRRGQRIEVTNGNNTPLVPVW